MIHYVKILNSYFLSRRSHKFLSLRWVFCNTTTTYYISWQAIVTREGIFLFCSSLCYFCHPYMPRHVTAKYLDNMKNGEYLRCKWHTMQTKSLLNDYLYTNTYISGDTNILSLTEIPPSPQKKEHAFTLFFFSVSFHFYFYLVILPGVEGVRWQDLTAQTRKIL